MFVVTLGDIHTVGQKVREKREKPGSGQKIKYLAQVTQLNVIVMDSHVKG